MVTGIVTDERMKKIEQQPDLKMVALDGCTRVLALFSVIGH
jgi:hypothetical protein